MHSKDIDKPKPTTLSGELIEIVEDCPMVVDKRKGKRSLVEAEESEEQQSKKMKLVPMGKVVPATKPSYKDKGKMISRVREMKKLARDKEGKKNLAKLESEIFSTPSSPPLSEAEEAGHTMPPPNQC
jgi:hypothetical protein